MEEKVLTADFLEEFTAEDLLRLLNEKKYSQLKEILSEMNEVNVAELFEDLDSKQLILLFRMLPKDLAAEVFANFEKEKQWEIINLITDKEIKEIVEELFFDDIIDLIDEMPANVVQKVIRFSNADERKLINQFLNYPDDSAGSLMTIEFVHLHKEDTVKQALEHIRETGLEKETVYTCYVTDKSRRLEGIVSLRKIVISPDDTLIDDIMDTDVVSVRTHDDQETVAQLFQKYGFIALPVVDNEDRLTGIITVDDVMDIMEQEATEDFQLMAAMSPEETPYLETSVWRLSMNRLPWLLLLMISATFSGAIMMHYEELLAQVAILTAFIPMLMDTGGNTGSQASTLVIRGLATGELEVQDWYRVLWKELRVSLLVGCALAVVNLVRMLVFTKTSVEVSATVSLTMILCVVIAKLVGGILPMIAKRLKLDPAIMAGPLITTLVDGISLFVYFNIARSIMRLSI